MTVQPNVLRYIDTAASDAAWYALRGGAVTPWQTVPRGHELRARLSARTPLCLPNHRAAIVFAAWAFADITD